MWECDLFDGGVCKAFPPPLVRGGVFLVGLETKYRDIADGNTRPYRAPYHMMLLETKYRDIADGNTTPPSGVGSDSTVGNQVPRYSGWKHHPVNVRSNDSAALETKYRDIADGNCL